MKKSIMGAMILVGFFGSVISSDNKAYTYHARGTIYCNAPVTMKFPDVASICNHLESNFAFLKNDSQWQKISESLRKLSGTIYTRIPKNEMISMSMGLSIFVQQHPELVAGITEQIEESIKEGKVHPSTGPEWYALLWSKLDEVSNIHCKSLGK